VLDGVQDSGKDDDGFDSDAAIITGELSSLIPDMLEALGGELGDGEVTPHPATSPAADPVPEPA
jgi:recombination associated protein RdgC